MMIDLIAIIYLNVIIFISLFLKKFQQEAFFLAPQTITPTWLK